MISITICVILLSYFSMYDFTKTKPNVRHTLCSLRISLAACQAVLENPCLVFTGQDPKVGWYWDEDKYMMFIFFSSRELGSLGPKWFLHWNMWNGYEGMGSKLLVPCTCKWGKDVRGKQFENTGMPTANCMCTYVSI